MSTTVAEFDDQNVKNVVVLGGSYGGTSLYVLRGTLTLCRYACGHGIGTQAATKSPGDPGRAKYSF